MPTHHDRRVAPVAVAVTAIAALLAGCSGGSASTGSSTTTAPRGAAVITGRAVRSTACAVLSPAAVGAALGVPVASPTAVVRGASTTCTFPAASRGTGAGSGAIVTFDIAATTTTFEATKQRAERAGGPASTLEGLGESAYSVTTAAGGVSVTTVASLQGHLQTAVISTRPIDRVVALAAEILQAVDRADHLPQARGTTTTT